MKGNLKKTIGIFFLAVLTLAAFNVLIGPSVRADSPEVKILNYSWYVAPSNTILANYVGDLVAVGEVQNVGSNVIGSLYVTGVAYDSTGTVLDYNEVQVFGFNLAPGQKAPFYMDFIPENSITFDPSNDLAQDQSWVANLSSISVNVGYVSDTNVTKYAGLTVSSSTSSVDGTGTFTVTGTIQNSGAETVGNVLVVTTFYNSSGSVLGLNFTNYLSSSFGPGDSVPFTSTPTDNSVLLSSEITNYSLLIQSRPVTTTPTPIPTPTPSELPTSSPTASPTGPGQPSGSSILIYVVVSVVVIVVVALVALVFLRKRHSLPPPPPPEDQESPNFS